MAKDDKLPRGHAYVHLRNRGYSIHIDFESVDNAVAGAVMEAALRVYREATDEEDQSRVAKGDA